MPLLKSMAFYRKVLSFAVLMLLALLQARSVKFAPAFISHLTEGEVKELSLEVVPYDFLLEIMWNAALEMAWPRLYHGQRSLAISLSDGVIYVDNWLEPCNRKEDILSVFVEYPELANTRVADVKYSWQLFDLMRGNDLYMNRLFENMTGFGREAIFRKVQRHVVGAVLATSADEPSHVYNETSIGQLIDEMKVRARTGMWLCCYKKGEIALELTGMRRLRCTFVDAHKWNYVQSYRWRDRRNFDGIGMIASNVFDYDYDVVTWVDSITHLNDRELKERTLREIGQIYAEGIVLPRYLLGREAGRPILEVLEDVFRGWMWQELNFGRIVIENDVGAIALLLVRQIKDVGRLEVINGRVLAVDPALIQAAIDNVNFSEFSVEADKYRASFAVIASLCGVDMDHEGPNAFNRICRIVCEQIDNHLFKLHEPVDGLRNITTFFSTASSTVTLRTRPGGSRFMSYGPWGNLELDFICKTGGPTMDGEYDYVMTTESVRASNLPKGPYFYLLLKNPVDRNSEHVIEVYVSEDDRRAILARVPIDTCLH